MKILIATYMTPQASNRYNFFPKLIGNFNYFIASDLCENFPFDFNISVLKNKCLKAAKISKADWLVLLSGIDASLNKLPNFKQLNPDILYLGKKIDSKGFPEPCSNWILSKKIYENYFLDENISCYGWDDFDYIHNVCANIEKKSIDDLLSIDLPNENPHLIDRDAYCQEIFQKNKKLFMEKYKKIHGSDFIFN